MLVFSHRPEVREAIITAVGRRPAPDLGRVRFLEAGGIAEVLAAADAGEVDLAILDGEAQPTGGMGVSRQLKNEIDDCPPIIVTVRRRDDRWLATWSQADAVLVHPLDPLTAAETVADVLRRARPSRRATLRRAGRRTDAVADTSTDRHGAQPGRACSAGCSRASDLGADDTAWVMDRVLSGEATPAQLAGFLVALRAKGETADEVAGLAAAMLRHARRVTVARPGGGRRRHRRRPGAHRQHLDDGRRRRRGRRACRWSSTATGPRRRPAGPPTCWRRSAWRSTCRPTRVAACVAEVGIGFCFAPVFHPAMRHAGPRPRGELGVPTAMNVLGPLTNPAQPPAALVGCADPRLAPVMAEVFAGRGGVGAGRARRRRARRAHHHDHQHARGWSAAARCGARSSTRRRSAWPPRRATTCAAATRRSTPRCSGRCWPASAGPVRDAVLLNAAGALVAFDGVAAGPPADVHAALAAALGRAAQAVDSGAGEQVLARWVEVSVRLRGGAAG